MSSPARAEARRKARAARRSPSLDFPDQDYGVMAGWCDSEEMLFKARRALHDNLIKHMGDRRTGAVTWQWSTGDDALAMVEKLMEGKNDEAASNHYRRLRAHLREYGGFIVIAMAPGSPS